MIRLPVVVGYYKQGCAMCKREGNELQALLDFRLMSTVSLLVGGKLKLRVEIAIASFKTESSENNWRNF